MIWVQLQKRMLRFGSSNSVVYVAKRMYKEVAITEGFRTLVRVFGKQFTLITVKPKKNIAMLGSRALTLTYVTIATCIHAFIPARTFNKIHGKG
jgi:hypothetical protein